MSVSEPLQLPALLYHWAPSQRRRSIGRYGLVPGKPSVSIRGFRPPFVCFGLNPESAWQMSGDIHPEVPGWDLWMTSTDDLSDVFEVLPYDDGSPKEVRAYDKTPGAGLWFVGTRQQTTGPRGH